MTLAGVTLGGYHCTKVFGGGDYTKVGVVDVVLYLDWVMFIYVFEPIQSIFESLNSLMFTLFM